ncbi:hypothetical protein SOCE26_076210 [Sorangium cellulosum]|uniref:Uncharacterized protein n=1 Tax=Sorangium cellulosum TaxID=56 RepID=A0A2L0F3J7_SORCE|nr:hypothetical protein [Sorangium cellulosum]AUX46116.1 hypothetical protein SOCE26_076210 [Sorangium cellulosum]
MIWRSACLGAFAAWIAGCQVVAPLPDVSDGGDGDGDGDVLVSDGSDGDAARDAGGSSDEGEPEPAPPDATGPCKVEACSKHCAGSVELCELAPQYPSVETCCTICDAMPSPEGYAGCRAVQTRDPAGCTAAGPLGPDSDDVCVGGCEALCTVFAALCPSSLDLDACMVLCAFWPRPEVFNACGRLDDEGSLDCRVQQIYIGLEERDGDKLDQVCRDALQGRCPKPKCEAGAAE